MVKSVVVAMPMFLVIYLFATDIFVIVFGDNWKVAGEVASILAPWLFLNFLTSPLASLFIIFNKQEIILGLSILYMLLPLSILWIFNEAGFLYVLKLITYAMSFVLIVYMGLLIIYIKKERKNGI